MQHTKVSVRGQTVVPREIREKFGIKPNSKLSWSAEDGVIIVIPIPEDPMRGLMGVLKGKGPTTENLLAERRRDLKLEEAKLRPWAREG